PSDRSVIGNRIRRGRQSPEAIAAVGITEEMRTTVDSAVFVLCVVVALVIGLPHLDSRLRNGATVDARDASRDPAGFTGGPPGYVTPEFHVGGVLGEEGAEDGRFGRIGAR